MSFAENLIHAVGRIPMNLPSSQPLSAMVENLIPQGTAIQVRLNGLSDSELNRRILTHIIGIERWATHRVGVFLGEPMVDDHYDSYRPPLENQWVEMKQQFGSTRHATLVRFREIAARKVPDTMQVLHNGYGMLYPRGWLRYIHIHAMRESQKLK
ncbi:MAG: hypothetical protein SGI73_08085 [Chloroflexota bacterium]|nr:hypothetical protein [Chloroflexota bacterium]